MLKKTLLIVFLIAGILFCQKTAIVNINVITKVSHGTSVYVTGNQAEFGNWTPDQIRLIDLGGRWSKAFIFPIGTRLEFKFTLGSWDKEALTKGGAIPTNHTLIVNGDTTLRFPIEDWGKIKSSFKGQITGKVFYYDQIESEGLKPRRVIVLTPPGYDSNPQKRYPVLYMHDGQNIFDPLTSFTGIDWQIDECMDSLIKQGKMDSIIVVGLYNTTDRNQEYSPTALGNRYSDFLVKTIKPMIDKEFRTKPQREFTATGGSSMGGLISFMLLYRHNDVFSKAICMSPAFKYMNFDYIDSIRTMNIKLKTSSIYIDNGGIELEERLQPGVIKMIDYLKETGFQEGKDLLYFRDENAVHTESAWAVRMFRPLIFLFGKR